MGTKNHDVVIQDVDLEATLNTLVGAAFWAAGQQCMATNTAPQFFGDSKSWEEGLKTRALKLKVTTGIEPVAVWGLSLASSPRSALAVLMSLVLDGCGIKVTQSVF
jgi:malonate-semialdehyde dehydrogenase (acetylating)/methylmalonate-semialdehyde dehydrogenase